MALTSDLAPRISRLTRFHLPVAALFRCNTGRGACGRCRLLADRAPAREGSGAVVCRRGISRSDRALLQQLAWRIAGVSETPGRLAPGSALSRRAPLPAPP